MNKKIFLMGLLSALGMLIYVFLVALFFDNAERILGKMPGVLGSVTFLLLFVFSAAVSAILMFGRPVYLFLNGFKKEAIWQVVGNLGWVFILLIIILAVKFIWF